MVYREGRQMVPEVKTPMTRTSEGLRDALFDEIDAFRRGQGDAQRATAIAKLVDKVLATAKLEHEVSKYQGADGYSPKVLTLGSGVAKSDGK